MPTALVNGVALEYDVRGEGPLVVLVMGTGSPGRVWRAYQVPALVAAGYRVATYDSRGIGPHPLPPGPPMTMDDLVADLVGLIRHLGGGPARVVGTSLGARVTQELALARPDLVARAVALAGHARLDPVGHALSLGQQRLFDERVTLPDTYQAAVAAVLNLSPATRAYETAALDWLQALEFGAGPISPAERDQLAISATLIDRRAAYRDIRVPLLVVGFADDLVIPPALCREVADAVPGARYTEVPHAGHYGYLERPDEVNKVIIDFLAG